MSKNTGHPYEKLTQQIFSEILNRDEVTNIEVRHDVTLTGITTNHQIDVYWEFEQGGIKYTTVVQAKDWTTNTVDQGELLKFKGVLDDLPGQPRGVFVTRTGYQPGALNFAAAHGILLYVLREPTPADYLQINMNLSAYSSQITDIRLIHDEGWRIEEAIRLRLQEAPRIMLGAEYGELALYDESNNRLGTLKDVIDAYLPKGWQEMPPTRITHQFERATFVKTGVDIFPNLKINAVEATISVNKTEAKWSFDVKELIGFILEDIIAGKKRQFDKDGKLLL
jgi:restriction endonuclease